MATTRFDSAMTPAPAVAYDYNGNTLTDASGKSYTWDFENRPVQAVVADTWTVTFKYYPFGRRIQKAAPLGTTNYLYDGAFSRQVKDKGWNVIEEFDSSGTTLARYTQGPLMDQTLAELRSGTTSYFEQDGIGSVTSVSSLTAVLGNTYTYDSFGNLTASTGSLTNPFRYTAREFDPETGIYEYRARYFDSSVGRFISEDPIRFKGGNDFYTYVKNNPLVLTDPLGLQSAFALCSCLTNFPLQVQGLGCRYTCWCDDEMFGVISVEPNRSCGCWWKVCPQTAEFLKPFGAPAVISGNVILGSWPGFCN